MSQSKESSKSGQREQIGMGITVGGASGMTARLNDALLGLVPIGTPAVASAEKDLPVGNLTFEFLFAPASTGISNRTDQLANRIGLVEINIQVRSPQNQALARERIPDRMGGRVFVTAGGGVSGLTSTRTPISVPAGSTAFFSIQNFGDLSVEITPFVRHE